MKKIVLLTSVIVSVILLASFASKSATVDQNTAANVPVHTSGHHHHHDYKGEMK